MPRLLEAGMSEAKLQQKLVCITHSTLGQQILDREFWQKLEEPLGWRLSSFTGQEFAEFYTMQTSDGMWAGLSVVTSSMRYSILAALGHREAVRLDHHAMPGVSIPLATVVPFPRSK